MLKISQHDDILYAINVSCGWLRLLYAPKSVLSTVEYTFHVRMADALIQVDIDGQELRNAAFNHFQACGSRVLPVLSVVRFLRSMSAKTEPQKKIKYHAAEGRITDSIRRAN